MVSSDLNKWILVKLGDDKTGKHFIGQIIAAATDGWKVKFVKKVSSKKDTSAKFVWRDTYQIDTVNTESIIKVLPDPQEVRRGSLEFSVLFDGYNI